MQVGVYIIIKRLLLDNPALRLFRNSELLRTDLAYSAEAAVNVGKLCVPHSTGLCSGRQDCSSSLFSSAPEHHTILHTPA